MSLLAMLPFLLFPRKCPICKKVQPIGRDICPGCEKVLPYIRPPFCMMCGKPVPDETVEYCFDCRLFQKSFQGGLSLFLYNKQIHQAMMDYKYHNRRILSHFFTSRIISRYSDLILSWNPDLIIPVPIHRNKRRKRGYNQAELLSRAIAGQLQLPHCSDFLIRTIDTLPQKQFGSQARLSNLYGAFRMNPRYTKKGRLTPPFHRILLVDDIYTTGATMEACSRILHEAGIAEVYILSVCIGIARDS